MGLAGYPVDSVWFALCVFSIASLVVFSFVVLRSYGVLQAVVGSAVLAVLTALSASSTVLVQIGVPSREDDPHYRREREHLEQLVGAINGAYSSVGRPPVHYLYQSVSVDEVVALYLAADVMLVTPLRDGMNLVAKEYVACRLDATGALVLSEFAGAAQELRDAILVNPHDLDGLKKSCERDRALGMSGELVLHPSNVATVNRMYSPSPEEVEFYRGMVAALDKAQADGRASCIYDGEHIDIAHVKTAKEIIALAESFGA